MLDQPLHKISKYREISIMNLYSYILDFGIRFPGGVMIQYYTTRWWGDNKQLFIIYKIPIYLQRLY